MSIIISVATLICVLFILSGIKGANVVQSARAIRVKPMADEALSFYKHLRSYKHTS